MKNKFPVVSSGGRVNEPAPAPILFINKKAICATIRYICPSTRISKQVLSDLNEAVKRWLITMIEELKTCGVLKPLEMNWPGIKPNDLLVTSRIKAYLHKTLPDYDKYKLRDIALRINLQLAEIVRVNAALPDNARVFKISVITPLRPCKPIDAPKEPLTDKNSSIVTNTKKSIGGKHCYYTFIYSLQAFKDEHFCFDGKMSVRTSKGKDKAEKLFRQSLENLLYKHAGLMTGLFEIKILKCEGEIL